MKRDNSGLPPQLLKALLEDRLVVFLGAGVSQAAGLPSGSQLADVLESELSKAFTTDAQLVNRLSELESHRGNLETIAQIHADYWKEKRAHKVIADKIAESEQNAKCDFLQVLKNLQNIREILTTNYDLLVEKVLGDNNCRTIYRAGDLRQTLTTKLKLYKLHGTRTDVESMVLTTDDYDRYEENHRPLIEAVKTLLRQKSLVIIGYSMEDSNFSKMYKEAVDDEVRNFFVSPKASLTQELHWTGRGIQHIPLSADQFFYQLAQAYEHELYSEKSASFPAPEKPPVASEPLMNPFVLFDTEALIEDKSKFLFETFVKPVDFPVILEHQHTIIEGHRGSGKSTILWRLSLKARSFDTGDLPMWGFYVKMVPGLFTAFRRRRDQAMKWLESDDSWMKSFTHYFNLILLDGILQNLVEANRDGVLKANEKLSDVVKEIGQRLLRLSTVHAEDLASLKLLVEEEIDTTMNDPSVEGFKTGPTFLSRVLDRLREAFPKLGDKPWHILLDEYDNVYPEQQAVVNILLRERHPKLRFKIAVKTLHMNLKDLDGKTVDPTDDFGYVSCDSFIWDKQQKAKYEKFLEEISNQRLLRSGYANINVRQLLPQDDGESEKHYAGFTNYCLLSSGLTRQFLELCKDAVYENFPATAFSRVELTPIPPRIQHHVARIHSAILFKSYRSCRLPQRVLRLFTVLGPLFWAIAECTKGQSEYRTPLSFDVIEMDKLTVETEEVLEDAIKSRLLQFPIIPKKPHNPRSEGPAQKYSFHRLLAPIFGLSLTERYTVPVSASQMNRIWLSPDKVREELAKGYRAKGISKLLGELPKDLFDGVGSQDVQ